MTRHSPSFAALTQSGKKVGSAGLFVVRVEIKSATLARLALIAPDGTTLKVLSFMPSSGLRFFLVGHFNKTKTARPGFTIVDDCARPRRRTPQMLHARPCRPRPMQGFLQKCSRH